MQYKVKIGAQIHTVDSTSPNDSGFCEMVVDGRTLKVSASSISPNHMNLQVDGIGMNLFVARTDEGVWIWSEGRARFAQDLDKAPRSARRGPSDAAREVTPPTPATVARILVEVGGRVTKGQPVIVVSAMKMEMTLAAPYSGHVRSVNAEVGAQVTPGDILVEIDPEPEGEADE